MLRTNSIAAVLFCIFCSYSLPQNMEKQCFIEIFDNSIFAKYFTLFPNPANRYSTLECPADVVIKTLVLYDVLGRKCNAHIDFHNNNNSAFIDCSQLSPGQYNIRISHQFGFNTKSLLIVR